MLVSTWITCLQFLRCVTKINFSTLQTKQKKLYAQMEIMKISFSFSKVNIILIIWFVWVQEKLQDVNGVVIFCLKVWGNLSLLLCKGNKWEGSEEMPKVFWVTAFRKHKLFHVVILSGNSVAVWSAIQTSRSKLLCIYSCYLVAIAQQSWNKVIVIQMPYCKGREEKIFHKFVFCGLFHFLLSILCLQQIWFLFSF